VDKSLAALFAHFFQVLTQHNWRKPIALTAAGKQYTAKLPQDLLSIVSSIEPCKNTARNITHSTAKILRGEFTRAAEISTNILSGKDTWASIYEPIDLSAGADIILKILVSDADKENLQKSTSNLEAVTIGLIIQLEQLDIFVRPNPQIDRHQNVNKIALYLNLPANCELQSIEQLVRDFMRQLNRVANSTNLDLSLTSPTR
jgi:poly(A) polymerase